MEEELAVTAFRKMFRGEPLSLDDCKRVWSVPLKFGLNVDTTRTADLQAFVAYLKGELWQRLWPNAGAQPRVQAPQPVASPEAGE